MSVQNNQASTSSSTSEVVGDSVTLQFLSRFIKPYSGERDKVHAFIRNCDNAMELASADQKKPLFNYICSQLYDKAELAIANHNYTSWNQLKEFLLLSYSEKKSFGHLQLELQTCKQTFDEDITSFMQKIETLQVKLMQNARTNTSDEKELEGKFANIKEMALQSFIINCLPNFGTILRSRDPQTLSDAYDIAIREEKIQKYVKQSYSKNNNNFKGNNKNNNFKSFRNNGNTQNNNNNNNNNSKSVFNRPNNTNNNNGFNKEKFVFVQDKFCNYCKKNGHIIQDCRKLKQKEERQNSPNKPNFKNKPNGKNFKKNTDEAANLNVNVIEEPADLRSLMLNTAE